MRKLKELFSDTLIYGVSSVLARFIGYLLVPLHTGAFAEGQYGIISLVFAAIALFNVLFTMGMESAYIRYAKSREQAKNIYKTLQLFLLGSSSVLLGVVWLLQPVISPQLGLETGDPILWMMLGILFYDTLTVVPFAELRVNRRPVVFAVLKTGSVLVNLFLNFYLILGLDMGIEAVFISNLAASALTFIAAASCTLSMWKGSWDQDILRSALRFGLPFVPAGFGHAINELLDRFFLKGMDEQTIQDLYGEGYSGDDIVGIYSACYKLAVFMLLIVQMYRMAWQPFFMRESDEDSAPQTFSVSFSAFNGVAGIVFLGVALFAGHIVALKVPILDFNLVAPEYWLGLQVVPILLGAYWFQGWYINFSAGIFIAEKTGDLARITLAGAAITIVCNVLLVPLFGMMGAATATLISYGGMALLIWYRSVKAFHVPYKLGKAFLVMGIAAGLYLLKSPLQNQFNSDFVLSLLLFVAGSALIWLITYRDIRSAAHLK